MDKTLFERSKKIFELTSELLMEDEGDDVQGEAYRFSYLILRGPKSFKKTFQDGTLYLDQNKISDSYWSWRFDIPGTKGLMREEEDIILHHNKQVDALST